MTYDSDVLTAESARAQASVVDAETRARQLRQDYTQTFLDSPSGWRVLQDLLGQTAVLGAAFSGNSRDIYNQGRRSVGMHILGALGLDSPQGMMLAAMRGAVHDPDMRQLFAKEIQAATQKLNEEDNHD